MKRRDYIKTVALGSVVPMAFSSYGMPKYLQEIFGDATKVQFNSTWHLWHDMRWAGPEYWGNRLQDWEVRNGKLLCDVTANNRNLHLLTIQNSEGNSAIKTSVTIEIINSDIASFEEGCAGMILGAKGTFDDYRSASVFGKGVAIGLTPSGKLKVGDTILETGFDSLPKQFTLAVETTPQPNGSQNLMVEIKDPTTQKNLFRSTDLKLEPNDLKGNFALLADFGKSKKVETSTSCTFDNWTITSEALHQNETQVYGPICFAQYTLHKKKLKLKAQFTPFEQLPGHKVKLQFKKEGGWVTEKETKVTRPGRSELFAVESWNGNSEVPYRIVAELPRKDGVLQYYYEGTIAQEPKDKEDLKLAVLNCNAHYGFPDGDIYQGLGKLDYDLCVFLGDQFYESTGGYGVQYTGEFDKRCLDFLRKWLMFGWSYREIFRHKPCAIMTDDHDMYHGNLWGCGGGHADTSSGFGAAAQDSGGYKMDADWVNMAQFTQTGHLPDAYDPTPVKQGINVYYTQWNYGGVGFAILEDRKFKSAPKKALPPEADVYNGFILNKDFDIKKHRDIDAEMLGERQESFLQNWAEDWSDGVEMKAVLSQTNFATVATLPKDAKTDNVVPSLYIPEKGEYIQGDAPTVDMDSNGWPQNKRDKVIEIIRKSLSFHIAGDQHLGTFIQYGVHGFGDGGYAFTGPPLNNLWPRRYWPPIDDVTRHTHEDPAYTGDHIDGFGNKITVHAVANPHNLHKEPEILYNRANGYGIVTFHKRDRTIKTDCYQRFNDPSAKDAQYPGWPITIKQEDNFLSKASVFLPELRISSNKLPVLKVFNEDGTLLYIVRVPSFTYSPRVFTKGKYRVTLEIPEEASLKKEYSVKAVPNQKKHLKIDLTA